MILNKLTDKEYEAFSAYVSRCGGLNAEASQMSYPKEQTLSLWASNKEHFFKMLGDNLIISRTIEYKEPLQNLKGKMNNFLLTSEFAKEFPQFFYQKRYNIEDLNGASEEYGWLAHLLGCSHCCIEGVVGKDIKFYNPKNPSKPVVCYRATKLMRTLKKLVELYDYDMEKFEKFRIGASQVTNAVSITGELCLSIHPLDFATMSDNANNWSSCMSWQERGDYRGGTIEMLNSPYIIMAYIKSDSCNYWLCDEYYWNSKKWRELFIVNEDVIMGIKDYPYHSPEIEKMVMDWIRELAQDNLKWKYKKQEKMVSIDNEHFSIITKNMYNDLMSNYNGKNCYGSKEFFKTTRYELDISPAVQCPHCGRKSTDVESFYDCCSNEIVCGDCIQDYVYCACCNDRMYDIDDAIQAETGEYICRYCYEENYFTCSHCGKIYHNDDAIDIVLNNNEYCLCDDCYDQLYKVFPLDY